MPTIYNKVVAASRLTEAISAIASYRGKKIGFIEQDLAYDLSGNELSSRTIKSWKNPKTIPSTIDDGIFFGLVYFSLLTERLDLDWLVNLLNATSVPIVTPISPQLLSAYLQQARLQRISLSERHINEIVALFYEENSTEPKGLDYIRKRGMVNFDPLQILIPLEPSAREFIRESKRIDMEGLSLFRFVEAFFHDFVYAVKNGAIIRAILVDPDSPAVEMVTFRSLSKTPRDIQRQRILNTINTLLRINQVSGVEATQVRTLNYMPPFGITIYHHKEIAEKSICQVRLYTFRTPTTDAPTILSVPKFHSTWFKLFTEQFELMWNEATLWQDR